jgi:hypothetical protein
MRTALQCRLANSTESVLSLLNLRKQKQQTLFALKLLCKETITHFGLSHISLHSLHAPAARGIGELVCDEMMKSRHYVSVFASKSNADPPRHYEAAVPLTTILSPQHQHGAAAPLSKKSRGLRLSSQAMLQEESHSRKVPSSSSVPRIPPETAADSSQATRHGRLPGISDCESSFGQSSLSPIEVIGSLARSLSTVHRHGSDRQFLILVCLRNASRSFSRTLSSD